jgi:cytochrome c oxidase subunit 2
MKRLSAPSRLTKQIIAVLSMLLAGLCAACSSVPISPPDTPSALDARGAGATQILPLLDLFIAIAVFVILLVAGLMLAALLRRRRATSLTPPENDGDVGRRWLIWGGIVLPLILLAIAFGSTIQTLAAMTAPKDTPLSIHVTGRQWWWQVDYHDQGIATANELHIPVGVPVEIVLQTGDVIHSFWVPQLHGKMDAIPGRINTLTIQADEAGTYRGECAEYCGLQHAHMGFMVIAESQEAFDQWITAQQQPATPPQGDAVRGQAVFLSAGCANCHMVRGLDDTSVDASVIDLGPDLTHLQTRFTLAGATLTNNRGNLAGWVVGAQHIKPGSLMPNIDLSGEDLQVLLAYLESLT